jgi:hypothetical protein
MPNPEVLNSRLKLLQEDVEALLDRLKKLTEDVQFFGGPQVRSHIDLQHTAVDEVTAITRLLGKIAQASSAADWTDYNEIRDNVAQINQEVLEIVQGLAIHREKVDETFCWIVRRFLEGIFGDFLGLTVFTARDLNAPTLARLTRVRFPVKSIWTLPFAAHQFANLKIKDTPELAEFAKETAASEAWTLRAPGAPDLARAKAVAKAHSRWTQMISDGLAVYFTGPCYAGSAILMRLSPAAMEPDDDSQASELDRAFVILEMLRQMDVKLEGQDLPYTGVINWLEKQWNEMLAAAGNNGLPDERRKELEQFVKDLTTVADRKLSSGKYPTTIIPYIEGSWSTAQQWSQVWQGNLAKGDPLRMPDGITSSSNVRDAFNAGWLCRSKSDDDARNVHTIGAAVLELCRQIVRFYQPQEEQAQPAQTHGRPGTRAVAQ